MVRKVPKYCQGLLWSLRLDRPNRVWRWGVFVGNRKCDGDVLFVSVEWNGTAAWL